MNSHNEIDYSNTIIYKIYCKDENISELYVGHTTNFVKRKKAHMSSCMKSNYPNYNCKLYQVIRNNGGWDNWQMMIIAFYNCKDLYEARQKEQYHYLELNATLNSVEPMKSGHIRPKKNECNKSKYECGQNEKHNSYNGTQMNNNSICYNCEPCGFTTTSKRDYERHLLTQKHLDGGNTGKTPIKTSEGYYSCPTCHNTYKSRTTTYTHIAKCKMKSINLQSIESISTHPNTDTISPSSSSTSNQYLLEAITKNQELTSAMMILIQKNMEIQTKMLEHHMNNNNILPS